MKNSDLFKIAILLIVVILLRASQSYSMVYNNVPKEELTFMVLETMESDLNGVTSFKTSHKESITVTFCGKFISIDNTVLQIYESAKINGNTFYKVLNKSLETLYITKYKDRIVVVRTTENKVIEYTFR